MQTTLIIFKTEEIKKECVDTYDTTAFHRCCRRSLHGNRTPESTVYICHRCT